MKSTASQRMLGVMDITQFLLTLGAVAAMLFVALLAAVPTALEFNDMLDSAA
jgi:hypothetical protein